MGLESLGQQSARKRERPLCSLCQIWTRTQKPVQCGRARAREEPRRSILPMLGSYAARETAPSARPKVDSLLVPKLARQNHILGSRDILDVPHPVRIECLDKLRYIRLRRRFLSLVLLFRPDGRREDIVSWSVSGGAWASGRWIHKCISLAGRGESSKYDIAHTDESAHNPSTHSLRCPDDGPRSKMRGRRVGRRARRKRVRRAGWPSA